MKKRWRSIGSGLVSHKLITRINRKITKTLESINLYFNFSYMQEMKKIIPQAVAEQDNFYAARPVTSNRRISNRSINGGSPLNRKLSRGFNDTHYAALGTSLRTSKKHGLKHSLASHHRDETASVVSLFSGPLSP